jgi:glycosyltransferase involved in cell wall biosynthesis
MLPRISLITPSFQQAAYLGECLGSIHAQGYAQLEHIVVDGGSEDGSAELIGSYADRIAWWCSERDHGQSHAINKGLAHATGAVFGWLNSDDVLLPGALQAVGEAFAADPDLVVFGGRRQFRMPDGTLTTAPLDDVLRPDDLFIAPCINQQSTFYRMDAVRAANGVDQALRYVMDLELWWRILFANGTKHVRYVEQDLAIFRLHAASKTVKDQPFFQNETAAVLRTMLVQLGEQDLVDVLDIGHPPGPALRAFPLHVQHTALVRRMVVHFLLKWNGVIHTRAQFRMMERFRRTINLDHLLLSADQRERISKLDAQLDVPGWLAFRAKRKLRHLRS